MIWEIIYSKQAQKDAKKIGRSNLKSKVQEILDVLKNDPLQPPYEKLIGDLEDYYSRRINRQHRLVYEVIRSEKTVHILKMWTHYE